MTNTDLMFRILKHSLLITSDKQKLDIKNNEWNEIYMEMCHHSIETLPYKYLREHPLQDEELYRSWMNRSCVMIGNWTRIMHYQQELLELLENNGIECVIIKGATAALSYPIPQLRVMGDVDFLVNRSDYEKTAELLEKNGYKPEGIKKSKDYHYQYIKDGIVYELHKRLAIVRESDEDLNSIFENGIKNREFKQLGKYVFPVLPTQLNGVVLLLHIDQHLRSGLGLRQIIDWMMYVHCNGLDHLMPLIRSLGMERFAMSLTAMCQKYFGLRSFVSDLEEYPCDELMDYVLQKGNFGRKSGEKGKVLSLFMVVNSPIQLFKRLQAGGISRWKTLRRHGWLKPFAWIYRVFSIISELKQNNFKWIDIIHQRNEAMKHRELINQLGLNIDFMEDIEEA